MAGSGPLSSSPGPNTFGSRGYGTSPGTAGVFGALSRRSGEDGNTSGRGDRPPAVRHSEDELLTALRKVPPLLLPSTPPFSPMQP